MATFVRWEDVSSDPKFLQLSPAEQEKVRNHYRNSYLKDLVPAEKLGEVQSVFDNEFVPKVEEPSMLDRAGDLAGRFNKGVLSAGSGILNAANIAGAAIESAIVGETLAPNPEWAAAADAIDTNRFTATRKEFDNSFVSDVAGGIGSGLGMAIPGAGLGRGARLAVGTGIGSAGMASSAYDQAIAKGATVEEATRLAALNAPLGITEAIPIERIVSKIPGFDGAKNMFVKMAQDAGVAAGEEGVQEFTQNTASQALEVDAGLRKNIDWEEAGYNALVGMGSGAGLSATTSVGAMAAQLTPFEQGRRDAGAATEQAKTELKASGIQVPEAPSFQRTEALQEWTNDETTQQGDLFNRTARGVGIQDMFSGDITSADMRRPELEGEDAPVRTPERQAELESDYLFDQQERLTRSQRLEELARREAALPAVNTSDMGVENVANEIAARGGNAAMADALARAGTERATGYLEPSGFEGEAFFPNARAEAPVFTPARTIPVDQTAVQGEMQFSQAQEPLSQPDLFEAQASQPVQPTAPVKPVAERTPDGSDLLARLNQVKQQLDLSSPAPRSEGVAGPNLEQFSQRDFENTRGTTNSVPVLGQPLRAYQSGNLTLGSMLDDVSNNPAYNKVPQTKALTGIVKEMASKLQALDIPIVKLDMKNQMHRRVAEQNGWTGLLNGSDKVLSGAYIPGLDAIFLNQDTPNLGVVLHEARHAMTFGAIELGKQGKLTGESASSYAVLDNLFNQFSPDISSAIDSLPIQKADKDNLKYGLSNLHEFTSELYSNPKFREVLKGIPISRSTARSLSGAGGIALAKIRNMYDAAKSSIQRMLGLSDTAMNALDVLAQADENFTKTITKEQRESPSSGSSAPRSVRQKQVNVVPDLVISPSGDARDDIAFAGNSKYDRAIKETFLKYLRSGGIAPRKLNEIRDNSNGEKLANIASSTFSRKEMDKILASYPQEATDEINRINKLKGEEKSAALGKLGQKYPNLVKVYDSIRREINVNTVKMVEGLLSDGMTLTSLEVNIIKSALDRMSTDSYNTVSYRINAPRSGILNMTSWNNVIARSAGLTPWGKAQSEILEAVNGWAKKVGWDLGGATRAEDKKRAEIVQRAVNFLAKVDLYIPDDIASWDPKEVNSKQRSRMIDLHDAYMGTFKTFDEVSNAQLIADLTQAKAITPVSKVQNMAKDMVRDILNLGNPDTMRKLSQNYKSDTQDLGIITPRENVPAAIRELMGEWEDAAHNLFTTMVKQGEWIARNKSYMEMRRQGEGTVFFSAKDRDPEVASEPLNSREYGALQGMYTSPAIKQWIDGEVEKRVSGTQIYNQLINKEAGSVLKSALLWTWETGLNKLSSLNKATVTVGNIAATAMNVMGSPALLLRDGNYSPKTWAKGAKVGIELIGLARRGTKKEEILEVIRRGLVDSVQAGEITNAQVDQLLKDLSPTNPLNNAWTGTKQFFTDVFAVSDAWTRISNYYNQRDLVSKIYEASGEIVSQEQIDRIAAERVRQTNMSYIRTTKAVKEIENKFSAFLPYMWEVFRTTGTGAMMAVNDMRRSSQATNPTAKRLLRNHAIGRGLGLVSASGIAVLGMGTVGTLISYLLSGAAGEPPEEKPELAAVVKDGVPEYLRGKFLHSLGRNSDGHLTFFDAGRIDPIGPVNELAASLLTGDPKRMADSAQGLFIANSLFGKLIMPLITDKPVKPGFNRDFPEFYESVRTYLSNTGLSPQAADQLLRASEVVIPKTGITALGTGVNYFYADRDQPGFSDGWQAAGMKLTVYNPLESVKGAAQYEYQAPMNKARSELREYIKTMSGGSGSPETIERMYVETLKADKEGFDKLINSVNAAKGVGAKNGELISAMTSARINKMTSAMALRGTHRFTALSSDVTSSWMEQELEGGELTRSQRQAVVEKYRLLKLSIRNLDKKYKDLLTEK